MKRLLVIIAVLSMILCLSACGESEKKEGVTLELKDTSKLLVMQELFYKNPMNALQAADPGVFYDEETQYYYVIGTSLGTGFNMWKSKDLFSWNIVSVPYKKGYENTWGSNNYWAPELHKIDGKYYLCYSALDENKKYGIGIAVSDTIEGPYADIVNRPITNFHYNVIDGNIFVDTDGQKYLFFSKDCSSNIYQGKSTSQIYGIKLKDDMTGTVGEPVLLATPEKTYEIISGGILWNEAPWVFKKNDRYYLMYASNLYDSKFYNTCYATSDSVLGTYTKAAENPVQQYVHEQVSGPGHNSTALSPDGSEMLISYHSHSNPKKGSGNRVVSFDRMGIREDGTMYVNGPTTAWQPKPSGVNGISNLAKKAQFSVSSGSETLKYLNDGEFTVNKISSTREWSGASESNTTVTVQLDAPRAIQSVILYPGVAEKADLVCDISFDNGAYHIRDFSIPAYMTEPGASGIALFDEITAQNIQITFKNQDKAVSLSEIMVLGK